MGYVNLDVIRDLEPTGEQTWVVTKATSTDKIRTVSID
jgi:hypothetical protein